MTTANDLSIYEEFAHEWWDPTAPHFRSLQCLTPFRLDLLLGWVGSVQGKHILDLGCGGGLLSVPLLNYGAVVTGVDLSAASIAVARRAAMGRGTFSACDICSFAAPHNSFDIVLLADVIDHVPTYAQVLREAAQLLTVGGKLFVGTLNRTFLSDLFAIKLGEGLGYVPRGTHDWNLFVQPNGLIAAAQNAGLAHRATQGEWPLLLRTIREGAIHLRRSQSTQVAYSMLFSKEVPAS